jgi:phage baseplate assembly protein W
MPIPQTTRVNPLDLQGNIAIGISLPFNGPAGPFNSTYSTQEQSKSDLINLLLTNKGERVFNPEFGTDLKKVLFEGITDDIIPIIENLIITNVNIFIPDIIITNVIVNTEDKERNIISITITYKMRISGQADQITVQFI